MDRKNVTGLYGEGRWPLSRHFSTERLKTGILWIQLPIIIWKPTYASSGGGLAGLCAAIACARNGGRVVLIQDPAVLGGNASSEIRVPIGGAYGIPRPDGSVQEFREGGIIEELQLFNLRHNPTLRWTLWDHVLYQFAKAEPRLTLLLNTTVQSLEMEGDRIASVTGWHLTQYCHYTVRARLFADCSGDSILRMSGARCTRGREGQEEYGESFAPVQGDSMAMGSSLMISALPNQKTYRPFLPPGKPIPFTEQTIPDQLRCNLEKAPYLFTASIETGGTRDGDEIRDELYSLAYGFWDFTKNQPGHGAELWNLEWLGSLPGRRESFRYLGDYVLTQNDIQAGGPFHDAVCHGGWPMDDHFPEGYRYPHGQTVMHPAPTPYGIPYRCLYSQNVENLFFGRAQRLCHPHGPELHPGYGDLRRHGSGGGDRRRPGRSATGPVPEASTRAGWSSSRICSRSRTSSSPSAPGRALL